MILRKALLVGSTCSVMDANVVCGCGGNDDVDQCSRDHLFPCRHPKASGPRKAMRREAGSLGTPKYGFRQSEPSTVRNASVVGRMNDGDGVGPGDEAFAGVSHPRLLAKRAAASFG